MSLPPDWLRPHFQAGGHRPLLCFWVPGAFAHLDSPLPSIFYRVGPATPERELFLSRREEDDGAFGEMLRGLYGSQLERSADGSLLEAVSHAPEYVTLRWDVPDTHDLNYLRDAVGLVAWLLDSGGLGVLDWSAHCWWTKAEWMQQLFAPAGPVPRRHARVAIADTNPRRPGEGRWFRTHGMRKFGRPDISISHVPPEHEEGVRDLVARFIEHQALGGVLQSGVPVRVRGLPDGMSCRHQGGLEDPLFRNDYLEISWSEAEASASSAC